MNDFKGILSRWGKRALWIIPLVGLLLFVISSHSFMVVGSESMKPTLQVGDLILTHKTSMDNLQVGDIIDYRVPSTFMKLYNYPPTICHRIVSLENTSNGLAFRTKGDNTSLDPFLVMPEDVIGKEVGTIRYLGYPVLFVQRWQGICMLAGILLLLLLYNKGDQLAKGAKKVRGTVFGVSSAELNSFQQEQHTQMQNMTDQVNTSMDRFSKAIAEYAKHLESHTSAVQSLAQAARHLETILAEHETKNGPPPAPSPEANAGDSTPKTKVDALSR